MATSCHVNPYAGLAESVVTSRNVSLEGVTEWSFSWFTSAGTTSRVTCQISNDPDLAEASFFDHLGNDGTALQPSTGSRALFCRFQRKVVESAASYDVDVILFHG